MIMQMNTFMHSDNALPEFSAIRTLEKCYPGTTHWSKKPLPALNPVWFRMTDCVTIISGHAAFIYNWIVKQCRIVVDMVNATRNVTCSKQKVVRLGAPLNPS